MEYYIQLKGFWSRLYAAIRGKYLPPAIECKIPVADAALLGEFSFCGYPVLQGGFYVPCGRIATQGCAYCDLHGVQFTIRSLKDKTNEAT
jgi:hypothetical protein